MGSMIKLSFIGDILIQREQLRAIRIADRYDFDVIFERINGIFDKSDYVCGNLETPVADLKIAPYTKSGGVFNTPIEILGALRRLGVNFLSTANNHCLDSGIEGAMQTHRAVVAHGFDTSGINLSANRNETIVIREIGGIRCAFLAYTYGTNSENIGACMIPDEQWWLINLYKKQASTSPSFNFKNRMRYMYKAWAPFPMQSWYWRNKIVKTIRPVADSVPDSEVHNSNNAVYLNRFSSDLQSAKHRVDTVFLLSHCGGQYNDTPAAYTRFISDFAITHGATHVIASHPHCSQAIRLSQGNITAWSLGNFCSWPGAMLDVPGCLSEYSYVLHLYLSKETKTVQKITVSPLVSAFSVGDRIARIWKLDDKIKTEHSVDVRRKLESDKVKLFFRLSCAKYTDAGDGEYQIEG